VDGKRDLPRFAGVGTLDECADLCRGSRYFGRQSYNECWCGDSYGNFGESSMCQCDDSTDLGAGVNCIYSAPIITKVAVAKQTGIIATAPTSRVAAASRQLQADANTTLIATTTPNPGVYIFRGAATFTCSDGRTLWREFHYGTGIRTAMEEGIRAAVAEYLPPGAIIYVVQLEYNGTGAVPSFIRGVEAVMRIEFWIQWPRNIQTTTTTTSTTMTNTTTGTGTTTTASTTSTTSTTSTATSSTTATATTTTDTKTTTTETTTTTATATESTTTTEEEIDWVDNATATESTTTTAGARRLVAPQVARRRMQAVGTDSSSNTSSTTSTATTTVMDAVQQALVDSMRAALVVSLGRTLVEALDGVTRVAVYDVGVVYFEGYLIETYQSYTTTLERFGAAPFDDGDDLPAAAMAGYIAALAVLGVLFFCCAVFLWSSRRRAVGVYKLPVISKNAYATFMVRSRAAGKDKKITHVVWDLSKSQADAYFGREGSGQAKGVAQWDNFGLATEGEPAAAAPDTDVVVVEVSDPHSNASASFSPIFPAGTLVEYYSPTWKVWVQGTIQVTRGGTAAEPHVSYDVVADVGRRKQLRQNVPLNAIRHTMIRGEAVEVYTPATKTWSPGKIADDPHGRMPMGGYRVQTASAGEIQIPRHLTRRRFDEGMEVRVYQGPRKGWTAAVVDFAGAPGAPDEASFAGLVPHAQAGDIGIDRLASDAIADEFAPETNAPAPGKEEMSVLPWTMVPVRGLAGRPECIHVPSYLLLPPGTNRCTEGGGQRESIGITFRGRAGAEVTHLFGRQLLGFTFRKSQPMVASVVADSEAEKSGVRPDMEIVAVNGASVDGKSLEEVQQLIADGVGAPPEEAETSERERSAEPLSGDFAVTFWGADGKQVEHRFAKKFVGFRLARAGPVVSGIIPGGKAEELGIAAGMTIVAVSGRSTAGLPAEVVEEMIKEGVSELPAEADSVELVEYEI